MFILFMAHTKFQIKDQFELRQGVTMTGTKDKGRSKKVESDTYKVVNLSGIDTCTGEISERKLVNYSPVREIGPDKLLSNQDYLISCKGEVNGYSMLLSEDLLSGSKIASRFKGIVASNHFLVLRPRMISELSVDDIRFLHNLLDILSVELRSLAAAKPGVTKYLTINDVANYLFSFPFKDAAELAEFKAVSVQYRNSLKKFKKAKSRLNEYNRSIADKILIPQ